MYWNTGQCETVIIGQERMDNDRRLRLTGRLIVTGIRRMIVLKYEVTRSTQRVKAEKITGVESTQSRLGRLRSYG